MAPKRAARKPFDRTVPEANKSATRNVLADRYPDAFCHNSLPGLGLLRARIAVHDSMQALKGAYVENKECWGDLVKASLREMYYSFHHYPNLETFAMCYDQYDRVPLAKSCEQAARSKHQATGEGLNPLRDFEIGTVDDPIPEAFSSATHHRGKWCREIIRFFVRTWATHPDYRPRIPPNKSLIVDGHYLNYHDLDIPVYPDAPLEFKADAQGNVIIQFRPDLAHRQGEGDLGMMHLIRKLAEDLPVGQTIVMHSIDSDMLYYSLKFLGDFPELQANILIRYWPGLTWCVAFRNTWVPAFTKPDSVKDQKWADVGLLARLIQEDKDLQCMNVELRVPHVVTALNTGGNDYLDALRLVPGTYYPAACFGDAQAMGPLIRLTSDGKWELDGPSWMRLLEYAVRRASTRSEWKANPGVNCGDKDGALFDLPERMPLLNDRVYRRYHVEYWLTLMNAIGHDHYDEPLLCDYAYARKDRDKPVSRHNLIRLHAEPGHDRFDSWDDQPRPTPLALPPRPANTRPRIEDEETMHASDDVDMPDAEDHDDAEEDQGDADHRGASASYADDLFDMIDPEEEAFEFNFSEDF